MACKNLKQGSLAEDMIIDHPALKELDEVDELIDWRRIEKLLMHIHTSIRIKGFIFKQGASASWMPMSLKQNNVAHTVTKEGKVKGKVK